MSTLGDVKSAYLLLFDLSGQKAQTDGVNLECLVALLTALMSSFGVTLAAA